MIHSSETKGVLLAAAVILSMALLMTGCGNDTAAADATTIPTYDVESTMPETLPPVQIERPEYTFSYSGELADIIIMKELPADDARDLEFLVTLSGGEQTIFALTFNSDQGELVTMLTDASGNQIPVAFEMAPLPDSLSDDDVQTFCLAQESVNEIVGSLTLK